MFEEVADKFAGTRFCCGLRFTGMELETLYDLYLHELRDLYSAEQQLIKALPKMSKAATNRQLSAGFNHHLQQTKRHATRLEQIFKRLEESGRGPKCEGMEGLIAEGDKMAKEQAEDEVRDAGLIAAATGGALRDRRLRLRPDLCRIARRQNRRAFTRYYPEGRRRDRQEADETGQVSYQRRRDLPAARGQEER